MSEYTKLVSMGTSQQAVRDHKTRMKDHLEKALEEEDLSEKNYYIRSTLQDLVIKGEGIRPEESP